MKPINALILFAVLLIISIFVASNSCKAENITIPGCNGKVTGPAPLEVLYPGVEMGIYTCFHDLENDGQYDLALIYVYNETDKMYELINAMRTNEYWDLMDTARDRQE